jgi:hypothetical protein
MCDLNTSMRLGPLFDFNMYYYLEYCDVEAIIDFIYKVVVLILFCLKSPI